MKFKLLFSYLFIFAATSSLNYSYSQDSTNVQQDTSKWTSDGQIGLNFSNVGLVNWSGGGESSYSFGGLFNYKMVRNSEKAITRVYTNLAYGLIRQNNSTYPLKKTDDQLNFGGDYSYKLHSKKLLVSASGDFRSQFDKGYEYKVDDATGVEVETQISSFFAPAYLNLNIGITYLPTDYSFITLSPIGNRMTFVADTTFSEKYGLAPQQTFRDQNGINIKFGFDKEVVKNVKIKSIYNMFAQYDRLGEWVVNWDFTVDMKVNKFLSCNFTSQLIYDPDVTVLRTDDTIGQAIQFKHALNIGLVYRLGNKDE